MNNNEKQKIFIASKGYAAQSLINITAMVEWGTFPKDLVFVNFRPGITTGKHTKYDEEKEISMLFDSIELRSLSYAMKEILKVKEDCGYKKFTSSQGENKMLSLGFDKDNTTEHYYINFYVNKKQEGKVIFSKWEFASYSDAIVLIADELDKSINRYNMELDKRKRAELSSTQKQGE